MKRTFQIYVLLLLLLGGLFPCVTPTSASAPPGPTQFPVGRDIIIAALKTNVANMPLPRGAELSMESMVFISIPEATIAVIPTKTNPAKNLQDLRASAKSEPIVLGAFYTHYDIGSGLTTKSTAKRFAIRPGVYIVCLQLAYNRYEAVFKAVDVPIRESRATTVTVAAPPANILAVLPGASVSWDGRCLWIGYYWDKVQVSIYIPISTGSPTVNIKL